MLFLQGLCHVIWQGNGYAWTAHLNNTPDFIGTGCEICNPLAWSELALCSDISDCTGQKVDNLRNH